LAEEDIDYRGEKIMGINFNLPYFEIGIKNYIYGDDILSIAKFADKAAQKYDIDVMMITPYTEIRRVAENTERLIVIAPYMDLIRPGRGIADVLPEALKAAGAQGVVINHSERPMSLSAIAQTIERARELEMLSFACAGSIAEAKALAVFNPDIINPEPTELIGGMQPSDMPFVMESIRAIKSINPSIIVEQAAGITSPDQVYDLIMAGAEAVGCSSAVFRAKDPFAFIEAMICSVNEAKKSLALK